MVRTIRYPFSPLLFTHSQLVRLKLREFWIFSQDVLRYLSNKFSTTQPLSIVFKFPLLLLSSLLNNVFFSHIVTLSNCLSLNNFIKKINCILSSTQIQSFRHIFEKCIERKRNSSPTWIKMPCFINEIF